MEDPVDEMDPQSHSGLTIKNRRKKFMKRKQLAALAAATVMALSLVGCGGGKTWDFCPADAVLHRWGVFL